MNKIIIFRVFIFTIFFIGFSNIGFSNENLNKTLLPVTEHVLSTNIIKTNQLKILKTAVGKIETLDFEESIIEDKGLKTESKCLCQAICFRVSQLAAQFSKDGVLRTYEIKKIRTGWNTDGPYEFFSNKELNGEIGDLEIAAERIIIEKRNGDKATSPINLSIRDAWYEITFINGQVISFQVKEGKNGVYPTGFLTMRKKMKNGVKNIKQLFMKEKKKTVANVTKLPFEKIVMQKGFIEK
jgi:hypothetical protein